MQEWLNIQQKISVVHQNPKTERKKEKKEKKTLGDQKAVGLYIQSAEGEYLSIKNPVSGKTILKKTILKKRERERDSDIPR